MVNNLALEPNAIAIILLLKDMNLFSFLLLFFLYHVGLHFVHIPMKSCERDHVRWCIDPFDTLILIISYSVHYFLFFFLNLVMATCLKLERRKCEVSTSVLEENQF